MSDISYEKLRELRDAGFPQLDCGNSMFMMPGDILWQNETDGPICINSNQVWDEENYREADCVYVPTLEELIEELGDDLGKIERSYEEGDWMAEMSEDRFEIERQKYPAYCVIECDGHENGDSPKESLINLYLALKNNPAQ